MPAATEFTVKLRKGLKWSDGKPFGSDDIGFFVNDIVANKELLPNAVDWMVSGGEPGKFEKIDDKTFKITFKEPYGVFPQRLASVYGVQIDMMAKHYCSQFHPAYNKDGIDGAGQGGGRHRTGPSSSSRSAPSIPRPMSAGRILIVRPWSRGSSRIPMSAALRW